jgi:hypothetical protein
MLAWSFSGLDPCQTSGVINVRGRRQPKPKRSHAASSITCFVVLSITMGVSKYWNSGWLSVGGLDSFLKFRAVPQLRRLDILPVIDAAAPGRFIKQECLADQIWISPPSRY